MLFAWLSKMNWRVALGDFLIWHLPVSAFPRGRRYSLSALLVTMLAVRVYY